MHGWSDRYAHGTDRQTVEQRRLGIYLGVYLESSVKLKCSFAKDKVGFYKAFKNILEQVALLSRRGRAMLRVCQYLALLLR